MIEEIWNIICETFTKVIKLIRVPLLFTILLISILGILFSAFLGKYINLIVFSFFTFIIIEMLGDE